MRCGRRRQLPARCRSTARHRYQAAVLRYGLQRSPQAASAFGGGMLLQPVGDAKAVAHAEVIHRQHIRAAELEHQQHLHRPAADAAHLREPRDDLLIGERVRALARSGTTRREGLIGQVPQRGHLGEREAGGAQARARRPPAPSAESGMRPGRSESMKRLRMVLAAVPFSCWCAMACASAWNGWHSLCGSSAHGPTARISPPSTGSAWHRCARMCLLTDVMTATRYFWQAGQ